MHKPKIRQKVVRDFEIETDPQIPGIRPDLCFLYDGYNTEV